ncbi:MAG: ATP-binding domain-containing protein, partial [Lentisphaeraceae bacterium]|nr:ATP-binding domain-containing protein [Lentisphaeraceae bacterium]
CQSIYSFRGALADQMQDFTKDFPEAEIVKLEDNYRSSQPILDMCNDVISQSKDVYPKVLNSAIDKTGPEPQLLEGWNDQDVAYKLIQRIVDINLKGTPLCEQAVLFRSSMHAMTLEQTLIREKIPYKKFGGIKITESAHLKDFMSIISCCFSKNPAPWLRTLQMIEGVGTKTAERALEAMENGTLASFKFPKKAQEHAADLLEIILDEVSDAPQSSFIKAVAIWYKDFLFKKHDDASSRWYDIENLSTTLLGLDSLSEFAADILLNNVETEEEDEENTLILSTIHSAKGKEWDCVYILNVADGSIPLRRTSSDEEEERRLLYVAMTRAREQLSMCWPKRDRSFNDTRLSAFLSILKKKDPEPIQQSKSTQPVQRNKTTISPQPPKVHVEQQRTKEPRPSTVQAQDFAEPVGNFYDEAVENDYVDEQEVRENDSEEPPDDDFVYVYDVDEW